MPKIPLIIQPQDFFATPEDQEALLDYIKLVGTGSDIVGVTTAAMMSWNLAAKLANQENEKRMLTIRTYLEKQGLGQLIGDFHNDFEAFKFYTETYDWFAKK